MCQHQGLNNTRALTTLVAWLQPGLRLQQGIDSNGALDATGPWIQLGLDNNRAFLDNNWALVLSETEDIQTSCPRAFLRCTDNRTSTEHKNISTGHRLWWQIRLTTKGNYLQVIVLLQGNAIHVCTSCYHCHLPHCTPVIIPRYDEGCSVNIALST